MNRPATDEALVRAAKRTNRSTARDDDPPIVVELFGLPGAGKSTICAGIDPALVDITRSQITGAWNNRSLAGRALVGLQSLGDIAWLRSVLRFVREKPLSERESWRRLARLIGMKHRLRTHDGVVLLDQGVLQALWSIFYTEAEFDTDLQHLSGVLRSFYDGIDAHIVAVQVPPDIAASRVDSRSTGTSRLDRLSEDRVLAELEQVGELSQSILRAARAAGLRVTLLDGTQPVAELVAQLEAILAETRSEARPAARPVGGRRISVVGSTGSGKTYLARQLSEILGLPHQELDRLRQRSQDDESTDRDFASRVETLAAQDRWVIDGHYRGVRHHVWQRADLVVHLDYSPLIIASQLLRRFNAKRRTHSEKSGPGGKVATASWSRRFARFSKTISERREYTRILNGPDYRDLQVLKLKNPAEARQWCEELARIRGDGGAPGKQ